MTTETPQLADQLGRQLVSTLDQQQQGGGLALQHAKETLCQRILRIEQRPCHHLGQQQLANVRHLHGCTANQAHYPHFFGQVAEQGFTQGAAATAGFTGEKNKRVIEFNQMQQPINQLPLGRKFKQFIVTHDQTQSPPAIHHRRHRLRPARDRYRPAAPVATCLPIPSCLGAYGE